MPEGHVIYMIASKLNGLFAGQVVRASSPQGRFAAGAALIDEGAICPSTSEDGKVLGMSGIRRQT